MCREPHNKASGSEDTAYVRGLSSHMMQSSMVSVSFSPRCLIVRACR